MKEFLTETLQLQFIFRIFLAGICGMIIGLERKNRSKEAGIRTHFVVACGAALMMVVSKYAFFDVISKGIYEGVEVRLDPSRIASTIASGIGFLGAGMIFVHRNTITGLTTAVGIWATSGVGVAIGAGLYSIGICATVLILFAQIILHKNFRWIRIPRTKVLIIRDVTEDGFQEKTMERTWYTYPSMPNSRKMYMNNTWMPTKMVIQLSSKVLPDNWKIPSNVWQKTFTTNT